MFVFKIIGYNRGFNLFSPQIILKNPLLLLPEKFKIYETGTFCMPRKYMP